MSYQVLARKWRPRNFDELVGQEHVLKALVHALDHDRLHHAFLFTGTRGVGKTTIARILAKSLNCEQGVSSKPCGQCATCQEIDDGRFVDLIEVDAASRTKVDETRDLLDNVQYAPSRGRYKVYLIDEVHMFSNHSFNALLKTLEEPPPHVKFLLATTDPQKLPVTILSRCLQFNLRRLSRERIQGHLSHILAQEGIESETPALIRLAQAADGSMRDALSLMDQAIAFGGGKVEESEVTSMLGSIERDHVFRLLSALAGGEADVMLDTVNELAQLSPDYNDVLAEIITTLHYLALLQQVPSAWDESMGEREQFESLAAQLSAEDIQLYYQIAVNGRRDLPYIPDMRNGLEMVLLRMLAFRPLEMKQEPGKGPTSVATATKGTRTAAVQQQDSQAKSVETTQAATVQESTAQPPANPAKAKDWHEIAEALTLGGALAQVVANCVLVSLQDDQLTLALSPLSAPMLTKEREAQLRDALSSYFSRPMKLILEVKDASGETPAARDTRVQAERMAAAQTAIAEDPNVQSIIDEFDGQIRPNSVEPID